MNDFICRLCLKTSDDVVNIWDTFQSSTIASILVKHFWFEVIHKDDGLTESLCQRCWLQTKMFHEFYKEVEQFQKCFLDATNSDVGRDETIDIDAPLEPDLNTIKCEETELRSEVISSRKGGHESSNDDGCESEKSFENDDQCSNNEQKERTDHELNCQIGKFCNMKCEICKDVEFETITNARQHYRKVHKTQGYIKCCGKKFTWTYEIAKHIRIHINPDKFKLDEDIRELFKMKCEICSDVELQTLSEVRKHFRELHKIKGYLRCRNPVCSGRKFETRHEMRDHIRYHKDPNAYQCDQCDKKFKDSNALKGHIANHVPFVSRKFKCTLCTSSFNNASKLRRHVIDKHTSKTGEMFPCEKCGKNFRSKMLLLCHVRQTHEMTSDHMCEVCARIFKTKQGLEYHISQQHSITPPPKVQCDICGVWVKNIHTHRQMHKESKPVNCPICNKEMGSDNKLRCHIAHVHGDRSYPCTLCAKTFKNAKNLKEHIAIHTGEDLYECPYCEKKFKSNANMYSHRKKMHLAEWSRDCVRSVVTQRKGFSKKERN